MHTPTPWHIRPDYGKENIYRLWTTEDNYPDDTSPEVMDENAEFMMRAVNSHEAMRTALKTILEGNMMAGTAEWSLADVIQEHYKIARQGLALAEGKE